MNLVEKPIVIRRHRFVLTNQRILFWPEQSALILADVHLGKTAHFRKHGIALPATLILEDLNRLSKLIQHYTPQKVIIAGDFLHAGKNSEFELFKEWKTSFDDINFILIKGNHDRISPQQLTVLGISEIHQTYQQHEILFSHQHFPDARNFVISGHIHPGVSLKSAVKKHLKFPAFILTHNQLILPAFSSFTGLDTQNHPPGATYYFFTEEGIYEL